MKKLILTAILAITLNAEMTDNCKKIRDKVSQQLRVSNSLLDNKEYPLAHVILTRLVTNLAWVEIECDKTNPEDKLLIDEVYRAFNNINEQKEELDKKYGVIPYEYERD